MIKVEPFASIVNECHMATPRLLLNMEPVGPFKKIKRKKDLTLLGTQKEKQVNGFKKNFNFKGI